MRKLIKSLFCAALGVLLMAGAAACADVNNPPARQPVDPARPE